MTDGRFDEQKLLHILNEKLKGISTEERAGRLKQVFGERGSMGIALLSQDDMLKQYDTVLAEAKAAQPNSEFSETTECGQSPHTKPFQGRLGRFAKRITGHRHHRIAACRCWTEGSRLCFAWFESERAKGSRCWWRSRHRRRLVRWRPYGCCCWRCCRWRIRR